VPEAAPPLDLVSVLSLREIRAFLRRSHTLPLATFLAVAYALGSMLGGGMLVFEPIRGGTTIEILTGSGTGAGWWNYPGLLVVAPWGILALPFFATIAMLLVSAGVGIGMAVAGGLLVRLIRPSPEEVARSKAVGAITGLTPAMIGLVTLGSCCTTTAAATGGIGLIAQASGTTTSNLLVNTWYLGVAQLAIVWAALVGQELLLAVYGGLLGLGGPPVPLVPPPFDRRWAAGAALRVALAVGGLLWSLSMLAEWTVQGPGSAGVGWWFRWIAQHQLLAVIALLASFYPAGAVRLGRSLRLGWGRVLGGLIAATAVSLLVWLPSPLPAWGLDSLGSQLLGYVAGPSAFGAIAVGGVTGLALVARWGLEYILPAGFALALVLAPERALAPLLATVARPAASRPAGPASPRAGAPKVPSPADVRTPTTAAAEAP
jgi:hypothetical protein